MSAFSQLRSERIRPLEALRPEDPRRLGPYTTLARLGSGGMGTVYLGHDTSNQLLAIKVLTNAASDASSQDRFRREIAATRQITSPYVANIITSNTVGSQWWYASQFIPGMTVDEAMVTSGSPLPYETVVDMARDVCFGLQAVHARGIVHRDLKPSNVMLSEHAHIIDLGIAHGVDQTRYTATGGIIGTASYMCPEQIEGKNPTSAWDMFALGSVLVYASTGRLPFGRGVTDPLVMMRRILDDDPDLRGVDHRLVPLVRECLQRDPSQRATPGWMLSKLTYTPTQVNQPQQIRLSAGLHQALTSTAEVVQRVIPVAPKQPKSPVKASLSGRRKAPAQPERVKVEWPFSGRRKPPVLPGGRAEARRAAARGGSYRRPAPVPPGGRAAARRSRMQMGRAEARRAEARRAAIYGIAVNKPSGRPKSRRQLRRDMEDAGIINGTRAANPEVARAQARAERRENRIYLLVAFILACIIGGGFFGVHYLENNQRDTPITTPSSPAWPSASPTP